VADARGVERVQTVVVGGGQSGLSVGYHLAKRGLPFVILEAGERIGDAWRARWDSLRLFTPARFDGLSGLRFPAPSRTFPSKDEMADYLEAYAARFALPVRTRTRVTHLSRRGECYHVQANGRFLEAEHVVVAMSNFQAPRVPAFAGALDQGIGQLHSLDYRNPSQLRPGDVAIVGAGNSGAEIAMELVRSRRVWLAGRDTGHVPFRIDTAAAHLILIPVIFRVVFHRVLTSGTPIGRKVRRKALFRGGPLIRVKPGDLAAAGVERVPRITGIRDGKPLLEDGRTLDVTNVIWCTGFDPGFSWIDLPAFESSGLPMHNRGIVPDEPGLYFVGLHFLHAMSSAMIHGVGRDAARIAHTIAQRSR
jgi:putative flavoprotein involved in K+ transport